MRKRILIFICTGLLLVGVNAFAGNGDLIVNGKVGIGTTSPGAKLSVSGGDITTDGTYSFRSYGMGSYGSTNAEWLQIDHNGSVNDTRIFTWKSGTGQLRAIRLSAAGDISQLYLATSGNVGIGTTNPESKLHLVGNGAYGFVYRPSNNAITNFYLYEDGTGYLRASGWNYGSDKRLKENITTLTYGINEIMQLKSAKFDYIQGQKSQLGFIAQDVQKVVPELVHTGSDGMLSLQTEGIIPVLVNAIQEQQKEINELKEELKRLQGSR